MGTDLEPLAYEYALRCDPATAFEVYTARIGDWWDPRYTANPDSLESVTIEPWVGGRVYASHADLGQNDWGEVIRWEPGRLLVHTFALAQDPAEPSEVAVTFAPDVGGSWCTFRLEHGGWRESNGHVRAKFGDWPIILDGFISLANAEA
jgi:uncharacterized protein YndB with AHSA1/START domain